MKRIALAALLISCAHAPVGPFRWPIEVKLAFAERCTILHVGIGNKEIPTKFYCACLTNEMESKRPESWLHVDDNDEDKLVWRAAKVKCLAKLYEAYPDQKPPTENPDT